MLNSSFRAVHGSGVNFILSNGLLCLLGFKPARHMVFAGVYPADGSDYEALSSAVERLTCNDASVSIAKETSGALGIGFRCGFLGLLHMDVFHQRLEQVG